MFKNIFVIAFAGESIVELVSAAKKYGEKTTLIFSGSEDFAVGADKAYSLGELNDASVLNYKSSIIKLIDKAKPELILTDLSTNGRLIAGILSGVFNAGILTDITELSIDTDSVTGKSMVYGGSAFKTESIVSEMAIICAGSGVFERDTLTACKNLEQLPASENGVHFIEKQRAETKTTNLSVAKVVTAAGRGVSSDSLLEKVNSFASKIGADVGCTRPVAEEMHLMPKETYIGVSGLMLKPNVYFALGVSGQVQHMVGVNQAKTIFAINKDKNAPIFNQCDYGLVADLDIALTVLNDVLA